MTTDDNNSQTNTNTDTSPVNEVPIWNGVDTLNEPSTADSGQSASVSSVPVNDSGDVGAYAKAKSDLAKESPIEQTDTPVQDQPSVVVSGGGNGKTPVWFYVLFLIVLSVFIITTYLLYQSLGKNKTLPSVKLSEKITTTPNLPTPTAVPTIFREEVDAELMKLTKLNPGDEIADLESDTGNTNLNSLEDLLKDLDNKFNFSSQP